MLRKLLISIALILPMNAVLSQDLSLPFPIPEGLKQLNGAEIQKLLSGNCISTSGGPQEFDECFEESAEVGTAAKLHGKDSGKWIYPQPNDWRVVGDYLCYRLEYHKRINRCRALAIDDTTGEIVAFDLKEARERDWENGFWRARTADRWNLFR